MNNRINNNSNNVFGLSFTGLGLIFFAATSTALLVLNNLPLFNGSLRAELLSEAESGIVTFMIVLFALAFVLICISYLLMALLGVNAVRFAKNPDGVKARTGLAKLLIVFGAVSLVSGIASMNEGATFSENMSLLYPSIVQTSFALSYLMEVKAIKSKSIACAQ